MAVTIITKDGGTITVARESYERAKAEKREALAEGRDMRLHRMSDGIEMGVDPTWVGVMMDGDQRTNAPPAPEPRRLRPVNAGEGEPHPRDEPPSGDIRSSDAVTVITKDGVLNVASESYEDAKAEKRAALADSRDMIMHRPSDGVEVSVDPSWVGMLMPGDQRTERSPLAEVRPFRPLPPTG